MALITARLEDRDLGSAVADIRTMLAAMQLPVGYTWEVGGQYRLAAAVVPRTAARLRHRDRARASHARRPVPRLHRRRSIILAAAPLSLGGAFGCCWLTGTDLNVSSAMGLILLVGLVVKNGIVLLDFAEMRAPGRACRCATPSSPRRACALRPILMTTLCTLFGLLPLALGAGRRRRTAAAAGAGRHRRAQPVDIADALPRACCLSRGLFTPRTVGSALAGPEGNRGRARQEFASREAVPYKPQRAQRTQRRNGLVQLLNRRPAAPMARGGEQWGSASARPLKWSRAC